MTPEEKYHAALKRYEDVRSYVKRLERWEDGAEDAYICSFVLGEIEQERARAAWYEAFEVLDKWADIESAAETDLKVAERIMVTGMDVHVSLLGGAL